MSLCIDDLPSPFPEHGAVDACLQPTSARIPCCRERAAEGGRVGGRPPAGGSGHQQVSLQLGPGTTNWFAALWQQRRRADCMPSAARSPAQPGPLPCAACAGA